MTLKMFGKTVIITAILGCLFLRGTQGTVNVIAVPNSPILLHGEAPHWDEAKQSLYFIDRFSVNVSLFRYDYRSNQFSSATILEDGVIQIQPSFVIPLDRPANQFALGIGDSVKIAAWNGDSATAIVVKVLFTVEQFNGNKTHFNDAKADPEGRFNGGTMSIKVCNFATNAWGGFYQRLRGEQVTLVSNRIKVSNGLTWDEVHNLFYYVDSCTLTVQKFNWNRRTGEISNGSIAYDYSNGNVISYIPDGMTIDTAGTLYNVLYQGAAVAVIDPRSQTMHKIDVPVQSPTSVAFGGPDLDVMFLTTCYNTVDAFTGAVIEHDESEPDAGKLFVITGLGRRGKAGDKLII